MVEPIALPGQLGFGAAGLYAGRHHKHSVMLVRAALDCGIKWIDTAPLYGHGAAETIVGEAIRGRRDWLTLVSKVGIEPTNITLQYRLHAKAAALAERLVGEKAPVRPPEQPRPRFNVFAPSDVVHSVERSLKALGTDRLDFLLLHEVDAATAVDPGLIDTLKLLVRQGKVLGFGTATQTDKTIQIAASQQSAEFAVFQVPDGDLTAELAAEAKAGIVLHSLLGDRLSRMLARLRSEDPFRNAARQLGINPDQPDLARRLMAHAMMRANVRAALFSTSNVDRLRDMASADELTPDEAEAGARLMECERSNGFDGRGLPGNS
jgi:aryl-alcohol dehydrogenase-like predicted oxidoreductase